MYNRLLIFLLFIIITIDTTAQLLGKQLQFDGIQDYVSVPDNDYLDITGDYTIEAWIQSELADTMLLLMKGWCAISDFAYYVEVINGHIRFVWDYDGNCSSVNRYESDSAVVFLGECAHIAIVFTNTDIKLYKNGNLIPGTLSGSYTPVLNSNQPLLISAYHYYSGNYGLYYYGSIDELRFWNYARTQNEITVDMYHPLSGNENGLVAYYDMEDNGTGTSIVLTNKAVVTGSQLDGTVYGSSTSPMFVPSCVITNNDLINENNIIIYPNPAKELVEIKGPQPNRIEIYNVSGNIIKTAENKNSIAINDIPDGCYILKIHSNKIHYKKLLIHH